MEGKIAVLFFLCGWSLKWVGGREDNERGVGGYHELLSGRFYTSHTHGNKAEVYGIA